MKMNQVREALAGIMAVMGNINDAIMMDEFDAYTSKYSGESYPAKLLIHVEDFTGFDENWDEEFQDYSEETVDAMEEWLDEHGERGERWNGGRWHFDGFEVVLEYGGEDI